MIEFTTPYTFYNLSDKDRSDLVGEWFKSRNAIYFPVQLANPNENYGVPQGLIFVSSVNTNNGMKWFRVGVTSPDDLDCDLDFNEVHLRQEVIEYLKCINKKNVKYRDILLKIQKRFNAGTITS